MTKAFDRIIEIARLSFNREKVDQFFASLDRDFDGRLTMEEIIK